ncbi:hypothetical protein [Paraburkholderia caffeinilytica]
MKMNSRVWWGDLQSRAAITKQQLVCAMMLCALAYVGSVPTIE